MNFYVNQKIKVIEAQAEHMACVDAVSPIDFSITIFDAVEILAPGDTVIIEAPGSDAVYLCQATVLKAISGSRNTSCVLSKPDSFSRVQRREFIRLATHIPLQFCEPESENWMKGQIQDISGNGVNISSRTPLAMGSMLRMSFSLKVKGITTNINTLGRVVREFKSVNAYQYGITFQDLPQTERDKIVRYILHESIKKRSLTSYLAGP